ncbi:microcompartments protein [Geitlerinema sp. PCC 7407]|nr:microcompartments protein [Geitlerinema sp. PCC 7407]
MELRTSAPALPNQSMKFLRSATQNRDRGLKGSAIGMVSTRSFPAIIGTADMMLKSAGVSLIGFEKVGGGYCTAIIRGNISDVQIAVASGVETAEQFGQFVDKVIIPRPLPNLEAIFPISQRMAYLADGVKSPWRDQALGLLETRGFPALVGAADAMLKSADVQLTAYETIGNGLCTAIIRGSVANVAVAVQAGMHEAERIGELNAVMVIPRPLDDMEQSLPIAAVLLEALPKPLEIPLALEKREVVMAELPEVKALPNLQELEKETIEPPES